MKATALNAHAKKLVEADKADNTLLNCIMVYSLIRLGT
jgi:hypothetical protein